MNSVTPVISVCVQTYQHKNYIRQCLDSVLSQKTNFLFEIILGEDDSTDGTREICLEYAAKHPDLIRLFLRSEKDKIYIDGRKTGRYNYIQNILAAEGKYIALLDGDDYWCDDAKLQTQFDFMEQNTDCSLSFHKVECLKEGGFPDPFVYTHIHEQDTTFTIYDLLDEKIPIPVSAMFKRSCVDELPEWLWKVPYIDYPLFFYCALNGKVGFINKAMGVYRIHPGGLWSSKNYESTLIAIWRQHNILCSHVGGDIQNVLLQKRNNIGLSLIYFYRMHAWENSSWFKRDLEQKRFPNDEILLARLTEPVNLKGYVQNGWNFGKHLVKKIIKTA